MVGSMDYRVDTGALDAAARCVQGTADDAAAAMTTMRLDRIPAAIPGSLSAGRAATTDAKWLETAAVIEAALEFHGRALQQVCANYRAAEDSAEDAIHQCLGEPG